MPIALVLGADAQAVIDGLIAASYTPSNSIQTAINNFYTSTTGLRNAVAREYGFVGGTATAHLINWQTPGTNNPTVIGTVNHGPLGISCADSSAISSNYQIPASAQDSFAMGLYFTEALVGNRFLMGATRIGAGTAIRTKTRQQYPYLRTVGQVWGLARTY